MIKHSAQNKTGPAPDPIGDPADLMLDRIRFAGFCVALIGAAFSISLASIGSVMYVLAWVAAALRRSLKKSRDFQASDPPRLPYFPLLAVLIAGLAVSIAINGFPSESRQGVLKYAWSFLLLYAGMDVLRGRKRWMGVAALILVCEGAAAASGIGQDFFGKDFINGRPPVLYTAAITRITGPFKHCNDFATFLIPGWLFGASLVIDRFRRRKVWPAAAGMVFLALIGWAMFRTVSRSAMIGAGAGTLVLAFMLPYRRRMLLALAAGAAAAWWLPSTLSVRLHQLTDFGGVLRERVYLIKGALKMIHQSPWFGLGPNTYSKWFPVFNPPDPSAPVLMYTHNSFLQIATETGWIGLGLYVAYVVAVQVRSALLLNEPGAEEIRWIRAAALASVLAILVNALFESLLQSTQLRTLFWCLIGISAAAYGRRDAGSAEKGKKRS